MAKRGYARPVNRGPDLLAGLNPAQRAAAEAVRGPVRILAGAGTGKTRTITHRIAHQVATGVARADQILAVTFTDRAAGELRARLAGLGIGAPVRAATFHAAAWAQLRWFWPRVEGGPLPEVLPSKVRLLVRDARLAGAEAKDLAAEIEWAKARCLDPAGYARAAGGRTPPVAANVMAEIYERYEQAKTEANAIDYEDMLLRMTALLARPDVGEEVRGRYRFLTVDEFQDVNPAQWALLRGWLGDGDELCVVGDDDQAIFSFTGASPAYLVDFERHFPSAQQVTLTENYRSTSEVLDLANRVLWTKPAARRKRLESRVGSGPAPAFREYPDADDEVAGVVDAVKGLLADGVPPREVAVCYRTNNQSEPFEEALRGAGIPYAVRGDGGFFDRPEIRQALTALRTAARRGEPEGEPPPDGTVPARPPRADRRVERVLRDQLSWHPRNEPSGAAARERWRNLATLLEIATARTADDEALPFPALVDDLLARAAAGQEAPTDAGAVTLLTLHRAKGTEFDAVFLVAVEEGLLPISSAKTDAEVEEERRLLYVGVTRARRHLQLSWARTRPGWRGTVQSRRPSRLLYNLGPGAPRSAAAGQAGSPPAAGGRKGGRAAAVPAGADPAVAERLRAWRRERSQRDGVPAYVVFPDSTLHELAARRPATPRALRAVPGFGPTRAERYGDETLEVIAAAKDDPDVLT